MKRTFFRILGLSAILLMVFWGCGKDSDNDPQPEPAPPGGRTAEVRMQNFTFSPAALNITRGTTVTWTNNDSDTHSVTADDNSFASPGIPAGGTYSRTFNDAGTISYHCTPHPQMKGTITVQ